MTNLDIMSKGVEFTSDFKRKSIANCTQTQINNYASDCLTAVCLMEPSMWAHVFTRQNNLRSDMLSLRKDDIKNELLKHAVNVTAYNRALNSSEASYLSTVVDTDYMTDDRIAAAISNSVEQGLIEESYSLLDEPEVLKSCVRSFVETVNDPIKKSTVPFMNHSDVRASNIVDSLDVYYARWKNPSPNYYDESGYGGK